MPASKNFECFSNVMALDMSAHLFLFFFSTKTYVMGIVLLRTQKLCYNWARGYETFFMLNSTEHEISSAHKFLALSLSDVVFIMLINVKMPTIVGILTFMSNFNIYEQDKFRAHLS